MTADPTVLFHLQRRGLFLLSPNRAAELLSGDLHRPQHDVVVYMDRTDMQLISTSTIDQRSNCGLVGKRSTESAYLRVLDQKHDLWLNDHIIDGIIYLPAAAAISMAFALSPYNNTELQCIEDFQILQPVVVRETPISLFLELEKKGSMIGMLGKTSVIHFRCYFREQAISNTLSYTSSKAERIINADTVYHDGLLFHGPTFQVLHQLLVLEDGKLEARIDSSRLNAIYGIDHWDRLTQWIDGAFQLLALAALLNQSVMAIPVGIRRILITKPQVKIASIKVSIKTLLISDGYVTGDVILREEGATPILILEGVKLKILRSVSIKNTSSLRLLSM
jgi:hypothetical protein